MDAIETPLPTVSVVVPAFNPGPYLRVALESVVAQTYPRWDAVVVDDGSVEDLSWVDTFHPRVRRVRQPNAGLSAARNTGIRESGGELVAFLDADDLWLPEKLQRQVDALAAPALALVSTGFTVVDGEGAEVSGGFVGYSDSYEELLQGNGICASTVVVRRSALEECGDFDTTLAQCEDWDMWLRIARTHRVEKVTDVLARYRVHSGNMTRDYLTMRRHSRLVLERQKRRASPGQRAEVERLIGIGLRRLDRHTAAQAFGLARAAYAARSSATLRHLGWAVRLSPRLVLEQVTAKARQAVSGSGHPRR